MRIQPIIMRKGYVSGNFFPVPILHLQNAFFSQLRNLFDSIRKNDMKKTESFRNFLGQEAAREGQVSYSETTSTVSSVDTATLIESGQGLYYRPGADKC